MRSLQRQQAAIGATQKAVAPSTQQIRRTARVQHPPVQASRRQAVQEQEELQQQEQQQQQEARTGFSAVVERLLHRAASSLTRGTATCLTCKGQGKCSCPACHVSTTSSATHLSSLAAPCMSHLQQPQLVGRLACRTLMHHVCAAPKTTQGTGITDRDARQNVMRHTTQKLRSVLGADRAEYHSDWLTSNRSVPGRSSRFCAQTP